MTKVENPSFFEDVMISGAFASMSHKHRFIDKDDGTQMVDEFEFKAPLGILGKIAEYIFLTRYMRSFLIARNQELKEMAETDLWKDYLDLNGSEHIKEYTSVKNISSIEST